MYKPSLKLLKKVCNKKQESNNINSCDLLIVLRHVKELITLIDHIINVIYANNKLNIIILLSLSSELYNKVINTNISKLCNFIFIYKIDRKGFEYIKLLNCMLEPLTIILKNQINFKYWIYHSESEYYLNDFNLMHINTNKVNNNIKKYKKQYINNYIQNHKTNWTHWRKFRAHKNMIHFFVNNNILPIYKRINGVVLPYKIIINMYEFFMNTNMRKIITELDNNYKQNYPLEEIFIPSYVASFYDTKCDYIGNVVVTPKKNNKIRMLKKDLLNNYQKYISVKRIDYSKFLLKYCHENYMSKKILE